MTPSNYDIVTKTFADKWYHHGQPVVLKRDIAEYKAGTVGKVQIVPTQTSSTYIGVHFFVDADPDEVTMCDFIENDPPLLTEYCEPIAEDDPRMLPYLSVVPPALVAHDDARLMVELFGTYFKGIEAYGQILAHYGEKFLDAERYAQLSENLKRAHWVAALDKEEFQKACLYFLGENASLDGFWEFYDELEIIATDGNPFHEIGVLLGKIDVRPMSQRLK